MLEERGYRRTWPPRMGDLTTRDVQMIALAEQAESYIEYTQRQQASTRGGSNRSLSERRYDADRSRREWEQSVQ